MLDADLAHDTVSDQCGTQSTKRPALRFDTQLLGIHSRVTCDRRAYFGSEDQRSCRAPRRLQTQNAVALEALQPAAHAASSNPERGRNFALAQSVASGQDNPSATCYLRMRSLREHLKPLAHFVTKRPHRF